METLLLTTSDKDIKTAADILKDGGLVGMPTETVYGLAANALSEDAVKSIFTAKGRPSDNPLIVHISDIEDIEKFSLVREFPESAKKLADKFWPGPLTIIMKKSDRVPLVTTGGLDSVAIRLPSHEVARKLIKEAELPLAAPSANLSGSPSPTQASHVIDDLSGRIGAVIDGGASEVGLESTVLTLCTNPPTLLRPGRVTLEELREVLPDITLSPAVLEKIEENAKAPSPGMKYRHYAPKAKVFLVRGSDEAFYDFINKKEGSVSALCYKGDEEHISCPFISLGEKGNYEEEAQLLFWALREIDKTNISDTVYVRCPDTEGVGLAVYNRLIRAAGFEVIDLEK